MSPRIRGGDNLLAMSVDNIGFLLDRLGQDCDQLQFLRELTMNSIEAIERAGDRGQIIWDVDWNYFDLQGTKKLSIIDTGDGMTGEEMVRFINQLSSSVSPQSITGNYGVGAKIAAATRNHEGVVYLSWKNGKGSMIDLFRDGESGQYGLKQFERADGTYGHFLPIDDELKPDVIGDHGTVVILHGLSEESETVAPPRGASSPSRWVSKYLNTRFFRIAKGITIKAREGWDYPRSDKDRNYLRTLIGQEEYLEKHKVTSGSVDLTGAVARWWILKDEPALTNNSGFVESSGHMAAMYRNELYELTTSRAGMSRLQSFGVTFGYKWVVIYVEPINGSGQMVTTNTARTALLSNNEPLPWADWEAEFRDNMPEELAAFVDEKAAASTSPDHTNSIRERLKDLLDLFKITRYRPLKGGHVTADDEQMTRGGHGRRRGSSQTGGGSDGGSGGGKEGNVYALFERKDGTQAKRVRPDLFPNVKWVSIKDGTREYGNIEDRGAKYHLDQNLLLINADFRAFGDMVKFIEEEFDKRPGVSDLATDAIHSWYEQALVETVLGIQGLRNSKEWSKAEIDAALTEEALTGIVMQRYHVRFAVKRELGAKLGKSRRSQTA